MPTRAEHETKRDGADFTKSELRASENRKKHADWVVTISFYKALHAVDAFLADKGIHPDEHIGKRGYARGRNERVRENHVLKKIYPKYKALFQASQRARYEAFTFEDKEDEVLKIIKQSDDIEDYVSRHIRRYR
jgi:uncharacterized protein (UPF0332 family)